eukprot:TRINITY_DN1369_c0_g1_i1.p2 TRINITY_DN1369_c0_g1~~TRINITY_DN1369_c0_g1_i1.p2  ORF type:complete len:1091 (+),score=371.26 TRINITY_DN1369_c0_g1_i1:82-3354(+)
MRRNGSVPAWERDGRQMKSLPSFTKGRHRSRSRGSRSPPGRGARREVTAGAMPVLRTQDRVAARQQLSERSGSGSGAASQESAPSEVAESTIHSAATSTTTPRQDVGKGTGKPPARSSVWLGARVRPTVAFEAPSLSMKCDVVDATVWITPPSVRHATPIPHPADAVFAPSSSQADVNTELCVETVPLAFGGGAAAVVCVGGPRAGKSSALFAAPGEVPDVFMMLPLGGRDEQPPAPHKRHNGGGSAASSRSASATGEAPPAPGRHALPHALRDTHSGGVVGAFFADVVKRVAGLAVYDITVTCGLLQVVATPSGDRIEDLLDPSSTVGVQETQHDKPELVGYHEQEVLTPHDFAKIWARVRGRKEARDAPPAAAAGRPNDGCAIATICVATVYRTDTRNGATSTGQVLFAELQPPEHSKHASLAHAALTKLLCAVGAADQASDPSKVFVPWRDSKFTRVLQCVFGGCGAYTTPRILLLSLFAPSEDMLHESLATAGAMAHIAKHRRGKKGAEVGLAEAKEAARKLQARLDLVTQSTHSQWVDAQEEILRLRREVALLKNAPPRAAARPTPVEPPTPIAAPVEDPPSAAASPAARPGMAPQAKGALALAKILQVLTRHKVVRPEPGSGTVAVLGQLISQLVARERLLHLAARAAPGADVTGGARLLEGGVWCEVLRELRDVEPTVVPSEDPRSAAAPFALSTAVAEFFNWYEGVGPGREAAAEPPPPPPTKPEPRGTSQAKEEAFRREVAWLKRKAQDAQEKEKPATPKPPPPARGRDSVPGKPAAKPSTPVARPTASPSPRQKPAKPESPAALPSLPSEERGEAPADGLSAQLSHELASVVGVLDTMQHQQLERERSVAAQDEHQRSLVLLQLRNQQRQQQQQALLEEQEQRLRSLQQQLQQHSSHLHGQATGATSVASSPPRPALPTALPQPMQQAAEGEPEEVARPQRTPAQHKCQHEELEWSLSPDNVADCISEPTPLPAARAPVGTPTCLGAASGETQFRFDDTAESPTSLQRLAEGLTPSPAAPRLAAPASAAAAPVESDGEAVWRAEAPPPAAAAAQHQAPLPAAAASGAQPRAKRFARPKCP